MYSLPVSGQPVFWIRHGETEYNQKGIVQGKAIDSSLSEMGKIQAQAFYEAYKHIPFAAIFTSSLQRTKQTVEPFLADSSVPHYEIPELDEIHWGKWEGKKVEEIIEELGQCYEEWDKGNYDFNIYKGESPLQALERVKKGLEKIFSVETEKPILVCAHSRISRIVFTHLFGYELKDMSKFGLNNTALSIISRYKNHFIMNRFNDTTHLMLCESL